MKYLQMLQKVVQDLAEKFADKGYFKGSKNTPRDKLVQYTLESPHYLIGVPLKQPEDFEKIRPVINDPTAVWSAPNDGISSLPPQLIFRLRLDMDPEYEGIATPATFYSEGFKNLESLYLKHISDQEKIISLLAFNGVTSYDLLEALKVFSDFKLIEQNYETYEMIDNGLAGDTTETLQLLTIREMFRRLDTLIKLGFEPIVC